MIGFPGKRWEQMAFFKGLSSSWAPGAGLKNGLVGSEYSHEKLTKQPIRPNVVTPNRC